MKKILITIFAALISVAGISQSAMDAYNFSSVQYGSTARSAAMGGAFGALGADFSAISINPAGLGVYRGGEFSFTPNFYLNKDGVDYLGNTTNDKKIGLSINNLGLVFSTPTLREEGVVSVNYAIGYNRLKDFNRRYYIAGNTEVSQLNYYAEDLAANGEHDALWNSYLAYESWLVDKYDDNGNTVYESILLKDVDTYQEESIYERGRIDEWSFALALNVSHKFYLGASFGIRDVYYRKEKQYGESFGISPVGSYSQWNEVDGAYVFYDNGGFGSTDYLTTTGYGFNAKLGAIYRPTDELRLGVSVHTPTYYLLEDRYSYSIDANVLYPDGVYDYQPEVQGSGELNYEYAMYSSPLNVEFSAAYVLGKYGVFSLDYGISDYSGMTLNERDATTGVFSHENNLIGEVFESSSSIRAGLELKVAPYMSLRGGYANYMSALTKEAKAYSFDQPNDVNQYSVGFGYRDNSFFMDFAYVLQTQKVDHSLFVLDNTEPNAKIDRSSNKIMMTLGFRF